MTEIQSVFWWDFNRREAGVLLNDGKTQWATVLTIDDLWNAVQTSGTRYQFEEDVKNQALVLIEDGEARYTSESL